MANAEKIDELISDKALAQWEKFVGSLDKAQTDMANAATIAATLNKNISKTGTSVDFEKATNAAAKATEDLARKRAVAALAEERLAQAQIRTAQMVERNAKRQAAEEEKLARERRTTKRAEVQMEVNASKDIVSARENQIDRTLTLVVNEKDLARAQVANATTAINMAKEQYRETNVLTESIKSQNDETIKARDILTEVAGTFEQLVKGNLDLRSELKGVQEELKEMGSTGGASRQELVKRELELKAALQESSLELRRVAKEQNLAEESSDQLSVRLDRLRAAWRGLSVDERDNTETGRELEKQINAIDEQLKTLDARVGVHSRKVGQYENATKDLNNALTSQFPILNTLKREYEGYSNILKSSIAVIGQYIAGSNAGAASTGALSKALRILRIALISTGIGAIVVVIGALIAYLTTTAEGIDKVTAVTRPLQAIMRALLGVLQNVGKTFVEAFTNPRKALTDIKNYIESSVIPQLKNVWDILIGITTLDFGRAKGGFVNIGRAISSVSKNLSDFTSDAIKTGQEIDRITKELQDGEIELIRTQSELNRKYREQSEISRDLSKSESDRKQAAEEGLKAVNALADQQIALQEKRIELVRLENKDTMDTRESLRTLAEAEAALDDIRADAARKRVLLTSSFNRATTQAGTAAQRAQREAEKQAQVQQSLTERQFELTIQLLQVEEDRANRSAQNSKRIADDERQSNDIRLGNLIDYLDSRDEAIDIAYEREAAEISKRLAEATKLEIQGRQAEADALRAIVKSQLEVLGEAENQTREELRREGNEALLNLAKANLSEEARLRQEAIQSEAQQREQSLAALYAAGSLSEQQYQLERVKLAEEITRRLVEVEIQTVQNIIDANRAKGIGVADEERKLAELKMQLSRQAADAQIADAERVADAEREISSLRQELAQELGNLAQTLFMQRFDREVEQIKKEKEALDIREEREKKAIEQTSLSETKALQYSNLTKKEKALEAEAIEKDRVFKISAIENKAQFEREQLEERQRNNQRRQARSQKAFAIAQAISNTAMGVSRAFADWPFPASAAIASIVGALGAVQVATIAAQPIPQFYKGTSSSPEGLAFVGERGTELIRYPDGSEALTPNSASLSWLPKGSEVLTNEQTKRYLAGQAMRETGGRSSSGLDISPMVKQQAQMNRQLKKMQRTPGKGTVLTKGGLLHVHRSGSKWSNYLKRNGL